MAMVSTFTIRRDYSDLADMVEQRNYHINTGEIDEAKLLHQKTENMRGRICIRIEVWESMHQKKWDSHKYFPPPTEPLPFPKAYINNTAPSIQEVVKMISPHFIKSYIAVGTGCIILGAIIMYVLEKLL